MDALAVQIFIEKSGGETDLPEILVSLVCQIQH